MMGIDDLESQFDQYWDDIAGLLANESMAEDWSMPGNAYFLSTGEVLALPRDTGDSRYPYGQEGFTFWAYAWQ